MRRGRNLLYTPKPLVDPVTGETLSLGVTMLTDGKYYWSELLPYVIEKYNYRLSNEIEKYILEKIKFLKKSQNLINLSGILDNYDR